MTQPDRNLAVDPAASLPVRCRALLERAEGRNLLAWLLDKPIVDPASGERRYRPVVGPLRYALRSEEVEPFILGVAAATGPAAVLAVLYRQGLLDEDSPPTNEPTEDPPPEEGT